MAAPHMIVALFALLTAATATVAQPPGRGGPPDHEGPRGGRETHGSHGGVPLEMLREILDQADRDDDGRLADPERQTPMGRAEDRRGRGSRSHSGRPRAVADQHGHRGGEKKHRPRGGVAERGQQGPPHHRGGQPKRPGPPHGERVGHDRQGPPRVHAPQPGQIVPSGIADMLNLTDDQQQQLAALQARVDQKLASILSDDQLEQLKGHHPPHANLSDPRREGPRPPGDDADRRDGGGREGHAGKNRRRRPE